LGVLIMLLAATRGTASVHAQGYTTDDTHTALTAASTRIACIVHYETGGTYDPYALGKEQERGIAQLHPRGLLPLFYSWGYTDPDNPYQAVAFLERALQAGMASHWTAVTHAGC